MRRVILSLAAFVSIPGSTPAAEPFSFRDVTEEAGLLPAAGGIAGHAAAWGDVDGDGFPDLYVGTFRKDGTKPNMFFRNEAGKFRLDDQEPLHVSGRASGSVFADFDNDGDLDFYLSNLGGGKPERHQDTGNKLLRNDGAGRFTDISDESGACPAEFRGRSAAVLDFDGDGLLDILVGEDIFYGSKKRSRLIRNRGNLKFEDVSDEAGLPAGVPGLGVAAADVNNDGWPDIFLASSRGGNRLFLNDQKGRFVEAEGAAEAFSWGDPQGDDMICGVCFGDVNGDGLLDVLIGNHFDHPWRAPVANRLYLNRGITNGTPRFEDVTAAAGLPKLPMKAPHVEIQDFDNDGRPDLYASVVKFGEGRPHPLIFRNLGEKNGIPQFDETALSVNDFPNASDLAVKRTGVFFDKMIADRRIIYMAPGPSVDFDRDGRLDLFLCSWWPNSPSMLLRNETKAGHWLQVQVRGGHGVNRDGIGSRVNVYAAGELGNAKQRLAVHEVAVGYGYASGQEAVVHVGLGEHTACDVEVILPHGKGRLERRGVKADQRVVVEK